MARPAQLDRVTYIVLRFMRTPALVLVVVYAVSMGGLVLIPGPADGGEQTRLGFPVCLACGQSHSPFASRRSREEFERLHLERCGHVVQPTGFFADAAGVRTVVVAEGEKRFRSEPTELAASARECHVFDPRARALCASGADSIPA